MGKRGNFSSITRFVVITLFFLIIQFVITGGISWYLYGLNFQNFSKVLPNVSFGSIVFGFIFSFSSSTTAPKLGDPQAFAKLATGNFLNAFLRDSKNDFSLKLFGRSVVVSGIIALAIYQFVLQNIPN